MKVEQLFKDLRIEYITEGNKHCTEGWLNVHCPFCKGSQNYYRGFHMETGACNCWRCGPRSLDKTIAKLLGTSEEYAKEVKLKYGGKGKRKTKRRSNKKQKVNDNIKEVKLPTGTRPLTKKHKDYLKNRGFDPEDLENKWALQGTRNVGLYKNRIIAPITYKGELVSYQGRDITDSQDLRYKACPRNEEKILHQEILYGYDIADKKTAIVVEGIADAWRMGPGTVATFGLGCSHGQFKMLLEFERLFIMRDFEDPQAQMEAQKLATSLDTMNKEVEIITVEGFSDPGSLPDEEVTHIRRELLLI